MEEFMLFAQPWWVNLLLLVPVAAYFFWQRTGGLSITKRQLIVLALFAGAFGFVEAAVVVYLRAAIGLLPGYAVSITDTTQLLSEMSKSFLKLEILREAATIVMLASVAALAVNTKRDRWAAFLWIFATWDILYYVGLRVTIGWPTSLTTLDILFLIPVPWLSPVWFPLLVSWLTITAVLMASKRGKEEKFLTP